MTFGRVGVDIAGVVGDVGIVNDELGLNPAVIGLPPP
jgi:hypothetical protein